MRSMFGNTSVFGNRTAFVATTIGAAVLAIGISGCTPTDSAPAPSAPGLPTSASSEPSTRTSAPKENISAVEVETAMAGVATCVLLAAAEKLADVRG